VIGDVFHDLIIPACGAKRVCAFPETRRRFFEVGRLQRNARVLQNRAFQVVVDSAAAAEVKR